MDIKDAVKIAKKEAKARHAELSPTCWQDRDGWWFSFDMFPSETVHVRLDGTSEILPPPTPDEVMNEPDDIAGEDIDITQYL